MSTEGIFWILTPFYYSSKKPRKSSSPFYVGVLETFVVRYVHLKQDSRGLVCGHTVEKEGWGPSLYLRTEKIDLEINH